jgi:hypothetical protein
MLIWLLPLCGGVLFISVIGAYNRDSVLQDWEFLLSEGSDRAMSLREELAEDQFLAERAHHKAAHARDENDLPGAAILIALAARVIRDAVPGRLERLRKMATCCRMASALIPLPPIVPGHFQLRSLGTIAGIGRLFHYLLVGMDERFRLRLWLLGISYQALRLVSDRSAATLQSDPRTSPAWITLEHALSDFKTLDSEHVVSFQALLVSLAAQVRATERVPGHV